MARRTLRDKPRISYYEPEEPPLDEYVFCEECSDYVFEYCAIHGPLLVIPDDKVPPKPKYPPVVPRAALTIPNVFLHLAPSIIPGAGIGVFSTLTVPQGVRFGPYRGLRADEVHSMYCWQIYDRNNKRSHVVDAADSQRSNWMRYVNCARHWTEQNLVAYQYKGELYYRTIKIIPRFTELLVFYGSEFANLLRVDIGSYNAPRGYASKFGAPVLKKPKLSKPKEKSEDISLIKHNISEKAEIQIAEANTNINKIVLKVKQVIKNKIEKHSNRKQDDVEVIRNEISAEENVTVIEKPSTKTINNCFEVDLKSHLDKPYKCDICNKCFNRKSNLNSHMIVHTGVSRYICDICNKCFCSKSYLDTHLRIHTGVKPYKCDICDKYFSDKSNLNRHMIVHTGVSSYKCDICNKRFRSKSYLEIHLRIHTGVKPYKCDVCYKCFNQKGTLNSHMIVHTGVSRYKCDICNKCFSSKSLLERHLRIHTGVKPYKCV